VCLCCLFYNVSHNINDNCYITSPFIPNLLLLFRLSMIQYVSLCCVCVCVCMRVSCSEWWLVTVAPAVFCFGLFVHLFNSGNGSIDINEFHQLVAGKESPFLDHLFNLMGVLYVCVVWWRYYQLLPLCVFCFTIHCFVATSLFVCPGCWLFEFMCICVCLCVCMRVFVCVYAHLLHRCMYVCMYVCVWCGFVWCQCVRGAFLSCDVCSCVSYTMLECVSDRGRKFISF